MSFVQRVLEASDTWLTPRWNLDPLGVFDLDPCAAPLPRPWDIAKENWTWPEIDGLKKPWGNARIWLNPPYGNKTGAWVGRLAEHGNGIALIFARTETAFWQDHIFGRANLICFLRGRVKFLDGTGIERDPAPAPSALVAYGEENAEFLKAAKFEGSYV